MGEADLTRALLGLHECALAPERYPDFVRDLEALLSDGPSAQALEALERHAEAIWGKASHLLVDDFALPSDAVCVLALDGAGPGNADLAAFLDRLPADDRHRLTALLEGQRDDTQMIVRAQPAGTSGRPKAGPMDFHLVRHTPGKAGRVRIFRLSNDLTQEVEALLASQFGITATEMQVLRGVVTGATPRALAEQSGKSVETIRSQVKSVAAKLGSSRQTEIAAAVYAIARAAAPGGAKPEADGLERITLRDGRDMFYFDVGDPSAPVVLFFHDFSASCRWPDAVAQSFAEAGLRLISPARAGFGPSSANPLRQAPLFEAHLADYAELIEQRGLHGCQMLAFGTGFGLAHTLSRRLPGVVGFLAGVNIYLPILSRGDAMAFPRGMYRAGALAALYAPQTCALMSRYASRRAAQAGSIDALDQLTGHVGQNGSSEARFFNEFVTPNLADIMAAGSRGVWRDSTCLTIPWTRLSRGATPVRGAILQNRDFPFQPLDRTRTLAAHLGLPFRDLARPYRHFVDDFSDVIAVLAQGGL